MGRKVHPDDIRLGIVKKRTSTWYTDRENYTGYLFTDLKVHKYLQDRLKGASVSRIDIHCPVQTAYITIHTACLGIVISKKGEDVEKLHQGLTKQIGVSVYIDIGEIRKPEFDITLVAQSVARQLEHRIMFRHAVKRAVQNAMHIGARDIRVQVSSRLGGAEIACTEWYHEGHVPPRTLRADVDYTTYKAHTTYSMIGVKVWVFKGEVIGGRREELKPVTPTPRKKAAR